MLTPVPSYLGFQGYTLQFISVLLNQCVFCPPGRYLAKIGDIIGCHNVEGHATGT